MVRKKSRLITVLIGFFVFLIPLYFFCENLNKLYLSTQEKIQESTKEKLLNFAKELENNINPFNYLKSEFNRIHAELIPDFPDEIISGVPEESYINSIYSKKLFEKLLNLTKKKFTPIMVSMGSHNLKNLYSYLCPELINQIQIEIKNDKKGNRNDLNYLPYAKALIDSDNVEQKFRFIFDLDYRIDFKRIHKLKFTDDYADYLCLKYISRYKKMKRNLYPIYTDYFKKQTLFPILKCTISKNGVHGYYSLMIPQSCIDPESIIKSVIQNNKSDIKLEFIESKKQDRLLPHLVVATISKINNIDEEYFIIKVLLWVFLYLSLVLYLSSRLLDLLFVEPVLLLASNASAIARGSDRWDTEIKSGDEFEDLNNGFKQLVTGLQERNILKSYISEDAFSDIEGNSKINLQPGGEYLEATIIFSAIKDYDKLSHQITPEESIQLLSKFMSIAEEVTKEYSGSIDKIIGDTIMLVFRNNPTLSSHGLRGAKAALKLVEKANTIGLPKLYTGIASGKVISGKIGSYSGKLDFTVIGNPVNLAARFKSESKNGTEQTGIIISGETIGLTQGKAKVKFLRRVSIKGKSRLYNIYELIGMR